MKPIASFTINHLTLLPGIYVSRKDKVGSETITITDPIFRGGNVDISFGSYV